MSVRVRWFATLVKRTNSKQATTTVAWRAGLSPREIFLAEGFDPADADPIMAVVNGEQAKMDAALDDGDDLEFLVGIAGGER